MEIPMILINVRRIRARSGLRRVKSHGRGRHAVNQGLRMRLPVAWEKPALCLGGMPARALWPYRRS
jgi:hypothetical protein